MPELTQPPLDHLDPRWDEVCKTHNWRNYISDSLRKMWDTFSEAQKAAIASNAQAIADNEDWD